MGKNVTTVKNLINTEDFKYLLMNLGDKLTQEEIDDMFEEFDFDDDGAILTKSWLTCLLLEVWMRRRKRRRRRRSRLPQQRPTQQLQQMEPRRKRRRRRLPSKQFSPLLNLINPTPTNSAPTSYRHQATSTR